MTSSRDPPSALDRAGDGRLDRCAVSQIRRNGADNGFGGIVGDGFNSLQRACLDFADAFFAFRSAGGDFCIRLGDGRIDVLLDVVTGRLRDFLRL